MTEHALDRPEAESVRPEHFGKLSTGFVEGRPRVGPCGGESVRPEPVEGQPRLDPPESESVRPEYFGKLSTGFVEGRPRVGPCGGESVRPEPVEGSQRTDSPGSPFDSWAEIYDAVHSYVRSDIPFYVEEARASGGPVLELGVGTGRVAFPIAASGIDVVGIDSSEAMLTVARRKVQKLGPGSGTVELINADMRDLDLRDKRGRRRLFPLITVPFRGFLSLLTVEDQLRALHRAHQHLAPGGRLAFNIFVPDPNMSLETGESLRHLTDVTDPETGISYVLYQQNSYDTHNQIVAVRMLIEELDDDRAVARRMDRDYQLRYCHRWEVHHLLRSCGLEIEALYGDFDRSDFDEDSTEMVWIARKR